MGDSEDLPSATSRTTRKRKARDLEMFQPLGEGSGPCRSEIKKTKKGNAGVKDDKKQKKRQSRCRIMGKFLRVKADPPPKPELCDLPLLVIRKILQFILVDDLENLANTNCFFFNWICSERRTSADIPFKEDDLKKMQKERIIEKKPLLKLRCKESTHFTDLEDVVDNPLFISTDSSRSLPQFTMDLQVSLLDFSKLRELDLVPSTGMDSTKEQVRSHNILGVKVLRAIRKNGTLSRVEKFDVMVDEFSETTVDIFGDKTVAFLEDMTKLRDFGLNILASTNLRKLPYTQSYLPMLEKAISSSKAAFLRLNVISETKRMEKKLLRSDHIQRIQFSGPCSFNGALLMPKLEVVEIDCGKYCSNRTGGFADPNNLHVVGKCGLMAASIYQNCPSIKEFGGVSLEGIDPKQDFSKWNAKVKKRFYKEYEKNNCFRRSIPSRQFKFPVMSCRTQPMILEFKDWVKINWFTSRYPPVNKK